MIDGLKIIKTIHATDRFEAYEARLDGQKVFAKKAKNKKTRELLAGVPKNSEIVNKLGKKSDFIFRAPQVCGQENDWLVTEWINGKSLGEDVVSDPDFVAGVLTEFFIAFDNEQVKSKGFRQVFTNDGLKTRMEERITGKFTTEQKKVLAEAKKLFDGLQPALTPALQDADLKPDHIFRDNKKTGSYVLIDSEHLSDQWPRFFDLGNNFSKFWIRGQKEFSNTLLRTFLNKSFINEKTIFKPMLATLIVRGVALHWEPDYDPGAENYNIPRAQAMLRACLKARNIEDLLY